MHPPQNFFHSLCSHILLWFDALFERTPPVTTVSINPPLFEYNKQAHLSVNIITNWWYPHETIAINYTGYDTFHYQDVINVNPHHADILLNTNEDTLKGQAPSYPFWCVRVLNIMTLDIIDTCPNLSPPPAVGPTTFTILYIQYFGLEARPDTS